MHSADRTFDPRKIKGVFFDLYGTLFVYDEQRRFQDDWFGSLYDGLGRLGLKADREEAMEATEDFFHWQIAAPLGAAGAATLYERRIGELGRRLGRKITRQEAGALAEESLAVNAAHFRFDEQAYAVLKELRGRKKLALITNFDHPPYVRRLMNEYALDRFFDIVTISSEVGVEKPDPRIFTLTLEQAGLRAGEAVYIGDSEEDDVRGARAAGLFPILIRRGGKRIRMDFEQSGLNAPARPALVPFAVVSSLTEIFKYL